MSGGPGVGRHQRRHRPVRRRRDQGLAEGPRPRALAESQDSDDDRRLRRLQRHRTRLWQTEVQRLADHTGLRTGVMHYPPGTSKRNKIEHRLFSYISISWRARPLLSRQTVIDLIAPTTTRTRLRVDGRQDAETYPPKIKVTDEKMRTSTSTATSSTPSGATPSRPQ